MKENITIQLAIKVNSNPVPNPCPLCGVLLTPNIGAELMLADSENAVCLPCGDKHAPLLSAMLTLTDAVRMFANAESDFGAAWEANRKQQARQPHGAIGVIHERTVA